MKLLTKELLARFEQVGDQSEKSASEAVVIAKFFNPTGAGYWYATEYDPTEKVFFGYVSIFGDWNDELGYFSLEELESYRGQFGLGIERDMHWTERSLESVMKTATLDARKAQ
jgi:hypothetical protein